MRSDEKRTCKSWPVADCGQAHTCVGLAFPMNAPNAIIADAAAKVPARRPQHSQLLQRHTVATLLCVMVIGGFYSAQLIRSGKSSTIRCSSAPQATWKHDTTVITSRDNKHCISPTAANHELCRLPTRAYLGKGTQDEHAVPATHLQRCTSQGLDRCNSYLHSSPLRADFAINTHDSRCRGYLHNAFSHTMSDLRCGVCSNMEGFCSQRRT